jgi:hypothetical protein
MTVQQLITVPLTFSQTFNGEYKKVDNQWWFRDEINPDIIYAEVSLTDFLAQVTRFAEPLTDATIELEHDTNYDSCEYGLSIKGWRKASIFEAETVEKFIKAEEEKMEFNRRAEIARAEQILRDAGRL